MSGSLVKFMSALSQSLSLFYDFMWDIPIIQPHCMPSARYRLIPIDVTLAI